MNDEQKKEVFFFICERCPSFIEESDEIIKTIEVFYQFVDNRYKINDDCGAFIVAFSQSMCFLMREFEGFEKIIFDVEMVNKRFHEIAKSNLTELIDIFEDEFNIENKVNDFMKLFNMMIETTNGKVNEKICLYLKVLLIVFKKEENAA